ncbi:Chitin synthase, class 1 [Rhizoclosmatium sp. JEL0117]|nr:Chitin synthase, class 1 [Rhizoclosmatium sp. JEL0117]
MPSKSTASSNSSHSRPPSILLTPPTPAYNQENDPPPPPPPPHTTTIDIAASVSTDPPGPGKFRLHRALSGLKKPKTVRTNVILPGGKFVVEHPVSSEYMALVKEKEGKEFTHLRYTAVTTDPNDFVGRYSLRQKAYGRKTRIAVVCTMYNEDQTLFSRTLAAVMDNIAYLCSGTHQGWNESSWQEIVVVVVSDGAAQVNHDTLHVLSIMGIYNHGIPHASVNGVPTRAHLFEFTTQVRVDRHLNAHFSGSQPQTFLDRPAMPMQMIFLLKEKNAKKINSHRWFFNAVCEELDPEVCILVDVGTKPSRKSFYHLYRAFERDQNVAGACGEITVDLGRWGENLLNPLVAVQNFEYKMSNILDKPLESMFGYISVLPGAFSAYRYDALKGRPLEAYFKGERLHDVNEILKHRPHVSEANMYLAEDRILCFELVNKEGESNVLKYVRSATAVTDCPVHLYDLIKQRRRWLNGSFFASLHSITNFGRIYQSGHGFWRMFALTFQSFYNFVMLFFSWFNIANVYLCFWFMFNIVENPALAECTTAVVDSSPLDPFYPYGQVIGEVLRVIYIISFISMVVASIGNKPEAIKSMHGLFAILFAIIMAFMLFSGGYAVYYDVKEYIDSHPNGIASLVAFSKVSNFRDLAIALLSTYGLYAFSSFLYLDPWHIFTSLLQYILMIPSFANILVVYAFCNIHDISWGTKGLDEASSHNHVTTSVDKTGQHTAVVDLPSPNDDADAYYLRELEKLKHLSVMLKKNIYQMKRKTDRYEKSYDGE